MWYDIPDAAPGSALSDKSGTIASANVSQQIAAANPNRMGFWIENNSEDEIYVDFGKNAEIGKGIRLAPPLRRSFFAVRGEAGSGTITVIGIITGQVYSAREW